ncbi:MAG: type II toxin-antitoxin system VapB family antitoxin [Thermoanaerobaculia bacterium]
MGLNIKDPEAERLAAEVARLTGESKTRAIRTALAERKERLGSRVPVENRRERLLRLLQEEIWPAIPRSVLGKKVRKKERERLLGYGPEGV